MSRKAKVCAPCAGLWRDWWRRNGNGTGAFELPKPTTCAHTPPRKRRFSGFIGMWKNPDGSWK